jgi:hypothetical protein
MSDNDEKPPEGAEIVSLDEARQRAEEKAGAKAEAAPGEAKAADPLGNALQPIMAAIARELAGLAGPDGTVKLDQLSDDDQSKAKTQALLRGLGQGLGDVLAQALGKWADKVNLNFTVAPPEGGGGGPQIQSTPVRTPEPPAPGAPDDPSKKS